MGFKVSINSNNVIDALKRKREENIASKIDLDRLGEFLVDKLVTLIEEQDPSWPVPSGWRDPRAWIETGELRDTITYKIEEEGTKRTLKVGLFDPELASIAFMLEFGSASNNLPERPLFRTVFNTERDAILEEIKKMMQE